MNYIRCRTCGKYVQPLAAVRQAYCSDACTTTFARCANCGGFFPTGDGYDGETCSQACAVHYTLHRFQGALSAGATSEERT